MFLGKELSDKVKSIINFNLYFVLITTLIL